MPNGTQRKIVVVTPLFSSDYAVVNREISEWNRRARPSFASIEEELNWLASQVATISGELSGVANSVKFGTVKTSITVNNPVVYLKSQVDALISNLQSQITSLSILIGVLQSQVATLQSQVATLITWQTPLRGSGDPNFLGVVGRFTGDNFWDDSVGPPGSYRWDGTISAWYSMA